jgi:voltage-gated potassium channel
VFFYTRFDFVSRQIWPRHGYRCDDINMVKDALEPSSTTLRDRLHEVVFEADTRAGKAFDVLLILSILVSVVVVMLGGVETIHAQSGVRLIRLEWSLTGLFTLEYLVRLASIRRPAAT